MISKSGADDFERAAQTSPTLRVCGKLLPQSDGGRMGKTSRIRSC